VLAELSFRDLVPAIWLPTPELRAERELVRYRLHLVKHRTTLKNRIHSSLIAFGYHYPVSDLFGVERRRAAQPVKRVPRHGSVVGDAYRRDFMRAAITKALRGATRGH
jgi:transposase